MNVFYPLGDMKFNNILPQRRSLSEFLCQMIEVPGFAKTVTFSSNYHSMSGIYIQNYMIHKFPWHIRSFCNFTFQIYVISSFQATLKPIINAINWNLSKIDLQDIVFVLTNAGNMKNFTALMVVHF